MVFNQPKHSSIRFLFLWLIAYPGWRAVRPSIALPPGRAWFCATWGVTRRFRHSATNPRVSKPLSPPTVTGFVPGICSSITSAASRSAVPLATNTSASTISPLRFSTNRFPPVAQLGLLPITFARQLRLGIGLRFMRLIRPPLAAKVHRGIAGIVRRRRRLSLFRLKALETRPGFQQRAVDREVLVGSQTLGPRLLHHLRQELLGHVGLQQPVAVLGEARRIPNLLVQVQPYEPAKQHAVIHLFHQQTFAADRVQHLQQLRSQQLLRRNRRTPYAGVHGVEPPRQLGKHFIHHGPDGAQRMIFPHSHLRRQITEHVVLLMICSSHTFSYHSRRGMRSSFSAAC